MSTPYTIRIEDHDIAYACAPDQNVLDATLEAGYEMSYSCRSGICGSCRGQIIDGEVKGGAGEGVLTESERQRNNVLLCQARPCSDLTVAIRGIHRRDKSAIKTVKAKVYRIAQAAPDVTVLQLRFPAGIKVRFKAGQYLSVHLEDGTYRHFSMANPPHQNDGAELHVRHVPNGRFSQRVAQGISAGDLLEVSIPYGDFYLREETDRPILLLASGTGFAPIKSLVEDAVKRKVSRDMVLYWGGRQLQDLYRMDLPNKWATQYPWFRFVPVLSDAAPGDNWEGRTGFVHQAVLDDMKDLSNHEVYACGTPAMVHAARQTFVEERGLNHDAFYCDAFVPTAATATETVTDIASAP